VGAAHSLLPRMPLLLPPPLPHCHRSDPHPPNPRPKQPNLTGAALPLCGTLYSGLAQPHSSSLLRASAMRLRFPVFLAALTLGSLFCCCLAGASVLHAALAQSGFGTDVLRTPVDTEAALDFLSQVPLRKLVYLFLTDSPSHILVLLLVALNALLLVGWLLQGLLFAWGASGNEVKAAREHLVNFVVFRMIFLGSMLETASGPSNASNPAVTGSLPLAPGSGSLRELSCWLMWFGFIAFLRWFLVLLRERFHTAQASAFATERTFRKYLIVTLGFTALNLIVALTVFGLAYAHTTWTVLSLLLYESVVLLASCFKIACRYVLYIQTLRREQPWEERGSTLYYSDMACEVSVQLLTLVHLLHVWYHYGLSLSLLDLFLFLHARQMLVGVYRNLLAVRTYRRSVFELNARFPDASPAELERSNDDVCSICRDTMEQAKKLPCGHLFHRTCLIQWVEHASFCPTCRAPLLPRGPAGAAAQQQQQQQQQRAQAPLAAIAGYPGAIARAMQPLGAGAAVRQMQPPMVAPAAGSGVAEHAVSHTHVSSPNATGLRHRSNAAAAAASHAATSPLVIASPSSVLGLPPPVAAPSSFRSDLRPSVTVVGDGSGDTEASYRAALAEAADSARSPVQSQRERIAEATQRRLRQAYVESGSNPTSPSHATDAATAAVLTPAASSGFSDSASAAAAAASAASVPSAPSSPTAAAGASSGSLFDLPPNTSSPALLSQAEADANLARELQREEELLAAEEQQRRQNVGGIARFFSGAI